MERASRAQRVKLQTLLRTDLDEPTNNSASIIQPLVPDTVTSTQDSLLDQSAHADKLRTD